MSVISCYSIVTIRNLCLFCNNFVLVLNADSSHPSGTLTEGAGRAPQNAAETASEAPAEGVEANNARKTHFYLHISKLMRIFAARKVHDAPFIRINIIINLLIKWQN